MTDERDPGIQALFDSANRASGDEAFVARVLADIDGTTRRTVIGWIVISLIMMPVAWWLAGPIMSTFNLAASLLPDHLVTFETEWMAQLLAPVNSAAGIAGLLFLLGWGAYRKIFG